MATSSSDSKYCIFAIASVEHGFNGCVSEDLCYVPFESVNRSMSQVAKGALLDFSPTFNAPTRKSGDKTNKENDVCIPVLSLVQFSRSPFVSFGSIKLGSSKSLPLRIDNPSEEAVATVTVDKISSSKGFSVDQTCFTIQVSMLPLLSAN